MEFYNMTFLNRFCLLVFTFRFLFTVCNTYRLACGSRKRGCRGGKKKERVIKTTTDHRPPRYHVPRPPSTLHTIDMGHVDTDQITLGLLNTQSCRNKIEEMNEIMSDYDFDIMFIVETWLSENGDEAKIGALAPAGYDIKSFPRIGKRGGGIAVIFKEQLTKSIKFKPVVSTYKTFQHIEVNIHGEDTTTSLCVIYRPPPSPKNKLKTSDFLNEFEDFVLHCDLNSKRLLILGDFNIHIETDNPDARRIKRILSEHNMTQHVNQSTHKAGHIIDWVITNSDTELTTPVHVIDKCISDHYLVYFNIEIRNIKRDIVKRTVISRNLKSINVPQFKTDLSNALTEVCEDPSVHDFNTTVRVVLDKHAPSTERTVNERKHCPWFTLDMKLVKQEKRRTEEKWRKSGLEVYKMLYIEHKKELKRMTAKAKSNYFKNKFNNIKTPKDFFQLSNDILGKQKKHNTPSTTCNEELANTFSEFFINKITDIRNRLNTMYTTNTCEPSIFSGDTLESFEEVSPEIIKEMICKSPSKSCNLDPIDTSLLKICIDEVTPCITRIINNSLQSGTVPDLFKTAIVTPLLKKQGLCTDDLQNYRPVSNLPFLSKILEKVVLKQISLHLEKNDLHIPFQSAYRKGHSTETALLRIVNDLLQVLDKGGTTALTLLDLSAAFDTVDHHLLLRRLHQSFGISGSALMWLESYLSNRRQQLLIGSATSSLCDISFGVPQGSVLGPVLFLLYTSPVPGIITHHSLTPHMYADDTQIYSTGSHSSMSSIISTYENCITEVSDWMGKNRLQLNSSKTEVLAICSQRKEDQMLQQHMTINNTSVPFVNKVKSLGVILDSQMSMDDHVSYVRSRLIADLRRISSIRSLLTQEACKKLVVSIILSKLDYCNSLLFGTKNINIQRLQSIQNSAARLILGKKRQDDATPLLIQLHWLPVRRRIEYKAATLVHHSLHDETAPTYISSLVSSYEPNRCLRSSSQHLLCVPSTRLKIGERCFSVFGPSVWNSLPKSIKEAPTVSGFKKRLKTFLFRQFLDEN